MWQAVSGSLQLVCRKLSCRHQGFWLPSDSSGALDVLFRISTPNPIPIIVGLFIMAWPLAVVDTYILEPPALGKIPHASFFSSRQGWQCFFQAQRCLLILSSTSPRCMTMKAESDPGYHLGAENEPSSRDMYNNSSRKDWTMTKIKVDIHTKTES
ncbi:hypothetical protein PGT21_018462 [Puccinia graminis f. sp. tritici]|uniref:Uncharacterized protein n=1 Tax=Puccinia graminis f. sp. tritici TaxID=56615 RepID=A0A5B0MKI5_PUCGR|nr:hypothetical protein PGT21_018462 [Puccinia graminis f. sp. tritici]